MSCSTNGLMPSHWRRLLSGVAIISLSLPAARAVVVTQADENAMGLTLLHPSMMTGVYDFQVKLAFDGAPQVIHPRLCTRRRVIRRLFHAAQPCLISQCGSPLAPSPKGHSASSLALLSPPATALAPSRLGLRTSALFFLLPDD